MRILRWILGVTLKDRKRNDDIRRTIGVACVTDKDKVPEARLRWYGHSTVKGYGAFYCTMVWTCAAARKRRLCQANPIEADVYGQRSRGRQRKRWIDIVKYDLKKLRLTAVDAEDCAEWRRRTRMAGRHQRDLQSEGESEWCWWRSALAIIRRISPWSV